MRADYFAGSRSSSRGRPVMFVKSHSPGRTRHDAWRNGGAEIRHACRAVVVPPLGQINLLIARRAVSPFACPAPFAKIFCFTFDANHLFILAIAAHTKGAFRDRHGRRARDAWTRWHQGRMVPFADGEVVWS
jgi:hypothetical protein